MLELKNSTCVCNESIEDNISVNESAAGGLHKLREYNYEMTKHMTDEERLDYYNKAGRAVQRKLEKMKVL